MKIYGGVYYNEDGLSTSIRAMNTQTALFDVINDNISGYNKPGYRSKEAVVSSFAELVGPRAISTIKNEERGRLTKTEKDLDFAIASKGFFQYMTPEGIKLTRDGRFKMDKDGYLQTLEGYRVLSNAGDAVKFSKHPELLQDIKVRSNGDITVFNRKTQNYEYVSTIGIASEKGVLEKNPDIKQYFLENSNVSLQKQFMEIVPMRRNFEANRQAFIMQNMLLSQTIQQLGRA